MTGKKIVIMRAVARSAGSVKHFYLIPGLTPRALCSRALRALSASLRGLGESST
jgi:hypothetical protein